MTDNDAAKALESLRTKICLLPTSIQACSKVDIETISIELAKSAKVDGLVNDLDNALSGLKHVRKFVVMVDKSIGGGPMSVLCAGYLDHLDKSISATEVAIQRFNGEG